MFEFQYLSCLIESNRPILNDSIKHTGGGENYQNFKILVIKIQNNLKIGYPFSIFPPYHKPSFKIFGKNRLGPRFLDFWPVKTWKKWFFFQSCNRRRAQEFEGLERVGVSVGGHELLDELEQPGSNLKQSQIANFLTKRRRRHRKKEQQKTEAQIDKVLQHSLT